MTDTADATQDGAKARVDTVFDALATVSDADLIAMRGVWTGEDAEVRELAWTKVKATARNDPRAKVLDDSRERLAQWVNDLGITWAGAYDRSIVVPMGVDQGNLRSNAVPAVLDAIVAVCFEDVLDDEERDVLLEPLRHVTRTPAQDE
jgi:hypothetical protein